MNTTIDKSFSKASRKHSNELLKIVMITFLNFLMAIVAIGIGWIAFTTSLKYAFYWDAMPGDGSDSAFSLALIISTLALAYPIVFIISVIAGFVVCGFRRYKAAKILAFFPSIYALFICCVSIGM